MVIIMAVKACLQASHWQIIKMEGIGLRFMTSARIKAIHTVYCMDETYYCNYFSGRGGPVRLSQALLER